jgi:hypothetical protein
MEEWKDIKGYEGYYQVSSLGSIKSLEKYRSNGVSGYLQKEIIMKGRLTNENSYYYLNLCKDKSKKTFYIHQLVAIHFLNHTPDGHNIIINHINGIKTDNRVENLELVTARENLSTCFKKGKENYSSQYVGVCWKKSNKKWCSSIRIDGKIKHLGLFDTEIDASNAYQNKLKEINSIYE